MSFFIEQVDIVVSRSEKRLPTGIVDGICSSFICDSDLGADVAFQITPNPSYWAPKEGEGEDMWRVFNIFARQRTGHCDRVRASTLSRFLAGCGVPFLISVIGLISE